MANKGSRKTKKVDKLAEVEITLKEIMEDPNIDDTIRELETNVSEITEQEKTLGEKLSKIQKKGDVDNENFKTYKKELEEKVKNITEKSKKSREKLDFYKAFKTNKKQILNIREYQVRLQEKLEVLEKKAAKMNKANTKVTKIEDELKELMDKKETIEKVLKTKNISEDVREKLEGERKKILGDLDDNNKKYSEAMEGIKDKEDKKEIDDEIIKTRTTISKCNMIWSSLLKGKDWNEISAKLATDDFTAKKGTLHKIKDFAKANEKESKSVNLGEVQKSIGEEVSEALNSKTTHDEEAKSSEESAKKGEEAEEKKEKFAEKHPRLAKIPFLAKFMDKMDERKKKKQKTTEDEKENDDKKDNQEPQKQEPEKQEHKEVKFKDRDLEYIDKQMEKGKEEETLKQIAEKGFRETVRADIETKRNIYKISEEARKERDKQIYAEHSKEAKGKQAEILKNMNDYKNSEDFKRTRNNDYSR